jgi:hypothetical protein
LAAKILLLVKALKSVDLPTFGKPTIPIDKLMIAIIAKYLRFIDDWVTISIMKNRVILFISIPAAVLFICVGLILLGYLYVGIKNPSQGVILSSAQSACGQSRVEEFKKIIDSSSGYDQKSFDGIVSDIKSKADYDKNPVCNYIVLYQASLGDDKNQIKQLKETFEKSIDESNDTGLLYKIGATSNNIDKLTDKNSIGRG